MSSELPVQRWPHHIVMSPSSLKSFGQCAYRVKLMYLDGIQPPDTWVRHFAIGNATHSALGTIAQQMQVGVPLIGNDQVRLLCDFHMPLVEYPTEEAREADVRLVLRYVERGTRFLERLNVEDWVLIERKERREVPLFPTQPAYKLLSKPDLVVKRTDDDGEPFLHIIDYKTGRRPVDLEHDVPVIQRYVLWDTLKRVTPDPRTASMRFTWLWLDDGSRDDVDVSPEHCYHRWPSILEQMEAMATETDWQATPARHCNFCPYYRNYCPEEIPYDAE